MRGLFLNVGSSTTNPNGRGRVDSDGRFEWLPIPETNPTRRPVPTYRQLGIARLAFQDLPIHNDPDFKALTYGHVQRFGEMRTLLSLRKGDRLFFMATLENATAQWATFVVGHIEVERVIDCRRLPDDAILKLEKEVGPNAHFARLHPEVDVVISGHSGGLWSRALPLSQTWEQPQELHSEAKSRVSTTSGKPVDGGKPWFRWPLLAEEADAFVEGAWTF